MAERAVLVSLRSNYSLAAERVTIWAWAQRFVGLTVVMKDLFSGAANMVMGSLRGIAAAGSKLSAGLSAAGAELRSRFLALSISLGGVAGEIGKLSAAWMEPEQGLFRLDAATGRWGRNYKEALCDAQQYGVGSLSQRYGTEGSSRATLGGCSPSFTS